MGKRAHKAPSFTAGQSRIMRPTLLAQHYSEPAPSQSVSTQNLLASADNLRQAGDLSSAVQAYRDAIRLNPSCSVGYHKLGEIFASLNDLDTALVFFNAAVTLHATAPETHNNLAEIYLSQNRLDMAAAHLQQATALCPQRPSYHVHLGSVLLAQAKPAEAEASIRRALELAPNNAEAHANLGYLQSQQLRLKEAEESYRRALSFSPSLAQAHMNLSHLLLRRGAFTEGWLEAEWRWRWKHFPSPRRTFPQPQWRGEPLEGLTLFLHAEQGFGDTLQMLRYVPLAAGRGARILLEVHPELRVLAAEVSGIHCLISRGDTLPDFDLHCPLMSLPLAFRTTQETVPSTVPYLTCSTPPPDWIESSENLRVGLVWKGNPKNVVDRRRSLSLDLLAPVLSIPCVDFYSLQLGECVTNPFKGSLPSSANFGETAAAIAELDLVISVDTAVAHLAGALGRPVWILLPLLADWRWLSERSDSPWYPSARLFRQENSDDWGGVLEQVAFAIKSLNGCQEQKALGQRIENRQERRS